METLNERSLPLLLWLQTWRTPWLDEVMRILSQVGREEFYILVFPWVYWCLSRRTGVLGALGLLLSAYAADFIKWGLNLPRPLSPPATVLWPEPSPGFVSSHAATSLGFWGSLAVGTRRPAAVAAAVLFSFAVGLSRVYLGSHFPTDVVGGWLVGALAVAVAFLLVRHRGRLARLEPGTQLLLLAAGCAAMVAIFPAGAGGVRPNPAGVTAPSVLFGFGLGLVATRGLGWSVTGPWEQRLARYCLGMALVLAGSLAIASLGSHPGLRFARYAYLGLAVAGLGPWLFVRLRLAAVNRGNSSEDEDGDP